MSRDLFKRIMAAVEYHDDYFKFNAASTPGLSCFQKVIAVFRMITYGVAADATDEYVHIGESTVIESLKKFVKAIIKVFEDEYLRAPNEMDTSRLLAIGQDRDTSKNQGQRNSSSAATGPCRAPLATSFRSVLKTVATNFCIF
jgi:hypothetical protein